MPPSTSVSSTVGQARHPQVSVMSLVSVTSHRPGVGIVTIPMPGGHTVTAQKVTVSL